MYSTHKTAKAILYGTKDGKLGPYVEDMVFVYDDKQYDPKQGNIIQVFSIRNTSWEKHIYPEWNQDPRSEPEYVPKRVVIDPSFKDFMFYDDKETDLTEFNSIDYWFANM